MSDQSRSRTLDSDILGLALGEVGLEQQGVQVVCEDGSPVIVEHGKSCIFSPLVHFIPTYLIKRKEVKFNFKFLEGVVTFVTNPGDNCMDAGKKYLYFLSLQESYWCIETV